MADRNNSQLVKTVFNDAIQVTPSDSVANIFNAIQVGVAGTLKVTTVTGNVISTTLPDGGTFLAPVALVWAAGTSATGIVGYT